MHIEQEPPKLIFEASKGPWGVGRNHDKGTVRLLIGNKSYAYIFALDILVQAEYQSLIQLLRGRDGYWEEYSQAQRNEIMQTVERYFLK